MRNYHLQVEAQASYSKAVRLGHVERKDVCSKCSGKAGDPGTKIVVAHHEDYAKPLDIVWLCGTCHQIRHGELRRMGFSAIKPKLMRFPRGKKWRSSERYLMLMIKGKMDRNQHPTVLIKNFYWQLTGNHVKTTGRMGSPNYKVKIIKTKRGE